VRRKVANDAFLTKHALSNNEPPPTTTFLLSQPSGRFFSLDFQTNIFTRCPHPRYKLHTAPCNPHPETKWKFTLMQKISSKLTFKNRASYILDGHTATLQMLHFIYFFFNKYKYWVF